MVCCMGCHIFIAYFYFHRVGLRYRIMLNDKVSILKTRFGLPTSTADNTRKL